MKTSIKKISVFMLALIMFCLCLSSCGSETNSLLKQMRKIDIVDRETGKKGIKHFKEFDKELCEILDSIGVEKIEKMEYESLSNPAGKNKPYDLYITTESKELELLCVYDSKPINGNNTTWYLSYVKSVENGNYYRNFSYENGDPASDDIYDYKTDKLIVHKGETKPAER